SEIKSPTEVEIAASAGFFMDDWLPKKFTAPAYELVTEPVASGNVKITADYSETIAKVSKYVFGTNANTYIGQLNEPAIVNHLKALSPNVIRFPGGNLSSVYFWNRSYGNQPEDVPDTILYGDGRKAEKEFFWYGQDTPDWSMSLDRKSVV